MSVNKNVSGSVSLGYLRGDLEIDPDRYRKFSLELVDVKKSDI